MSQLRTVYQWQCQYCETTLLGDSADATNSAGREHLLEQHRRTLIEQYAGEIAGSECRSRCGYRYPENPNAIKRGVCPTCGTDVIEYYAGRYIWQDVERVNP